MNVFFPQKYSGDHLPGSQRTQLIKSLGWLLLFSLSACGGGGSGSKDTTPASTAASSVASVAASSVAASSVAASSTPASSTPASSVAASSTPASSASSSSSPPFTLASTGMTDGATIPSKFTCDGSNVNPQLHWDNVPTGTKSFAIIVDDPDALAAFGQIWVHWNLFNIPGTATEVAEGASPSASLLPAGSQEGSTSFGSAKYGGPCPPSGRHHYLFAVYALNKDTITFNAPSNRSQFETAHASDIIDKAYLNGYFR